MHFRRRKMQPGSGAALKPMHPLLLIGRIFIYLFLSSANTNSHHVILHCIYDVDGVIVECRTTMSNDNAERQCRTKMSNENHIMHDRIDRRSSIRIQNRYGNCSFVKLFVRLSVVFWWGTFICCFLLCLCEVCSLKRFIYVLYNVYHVVCDTIQYFPVGTERGDYTCTAR